MHINSLPTEITTLILEYAACANQRGGVSYSYGLCQTSSLTPLSPQRNVGANSKPKLNRYVRGPIPPDTLRWDATAAMRQVCWAWHEWALRYALRDVFIKRLVVILLLLPSTVSILLRCPLGRKY